MPCCKEALAQAQLGDRHFRVLSERGAIRRSGAGSVSGLKQCISQIALRASLIGFRLNGLLQERRRCGCVMIAQQNHSGIQLGFIQTRFEYKYSFIFCYRISVFVQTGVGQREVEQRCVILRISCRKPGENVFSFLIVLVV